MAVSDHKAVPLRTRRAHASYVDSGIDWLGKVPAHWKMARVSEAAEVINGYPFDSEYFVRTEGIPLVRIRDLYDEETEVSYAGPVVESAWVAPGDVLVGMDGDFNVGRWRGPRALLNQRMCCVRPRRFSDAGYLAYLLPLPLRVINDLTYSTTVKHLSSGDVRKIRYAAPPVEEQRRIAAFLDRETAKIDVLIARKERLLALLQERRLAVLSRATMGGLTPSSADGPMAEFAGVLPEGWRLNRLRHLVVRVEQGWSPLCENRQAEEGEWGVLKVGCVNGEEFDESEHKALPPAIAPALEYEIRSGDILMSRANTRQLLGSAALVKVVRSRLLLCDKLYRIRVRKDRLLPEYLVCVLKARALRYQLEREATGASGSMQNISQQTLANLVLPVPPLEEQRRILEELESATRSEGELTRRVREAELDLAEFRAALISAAVTGKIDVREEAA